MVNHNGGYFDRLMMTNAEFLCSMEPEAEENCDSLLNTAMQVDPMNVEAIQALASVRMSQQRTDDARACVLQAWGLWKDIPAGQWPTIEAIDKSDYLPLG